MVRVSIQTLLSALLASFFVIQVSSAATSSEDSNLGALLSCLRTDSIPLEFDSLHIPVPPKLEEAYRQFIPMVYQRIKHDQEYVDAKLVHISVVDELREVESGSGIDAVEFSTTIDGHKIAVYYYYFGRTLMVLCKDTTIPDVNKIRNALIEEIRRILCHSAISKALEFVWLSGPQGPSIVDAILESAGALERFGPLIERMISVYPDTLDPKDLSSYSYFKSTLNGELRGLLYTYDGIHLGDPNGKPVAFIGTNLESDRLTVNLDHLQDSCDFGNSGIIYLGPKLSNLLSRVGKDILSPDILSKMRGVYRGLICEASKAIAGVPSRAIIGFTRLSISTRAEIWSESGVGALRASMNVDGRCVAVYFYYYNDKLMTCCKSIVIPTTKSVSGRNSETPRSVWPNPASNQAIQPAAMTGGLRDNLLIALVLWMLFAYGTF